MNSVSDYLPCSAYSELQSFGSVFKKSRPHAFWQFLILCASGPTPKCCVLGKNNFLMMLKAPWWTWLPPDFVWPWVHWSVLIHRFPSWLMKFVIFLSPILWLSCLFRLSSCVCLDAHLKWLGNWAGFSSLISMKLFLMIEANARMWAWGTNFFSSQCRTKEPWFLLRSHNTCNNFFWLLGFWINHFVANPKAEILLVCNSVSLVTYFWFFTWLLSWRGILKLLCSG